MIKQPLHCGMIGLMLLSGCAVPPVPPWGSDVKGRIDATLAETLAAEPETALTIPPEVSMALLPPVELTDATGKVVPLDHRFDVKANKAPAKEVFISMAEGTPYSVVIHPDVEGEITIDLKNVTFPEAMNAIRQVHGYSYRREGSRFFVFGRGLQTRIFPVNYLNFTRSGSSTMTVSASGLAGGSGGGAQSDSSSDSESSDGGGDGSSAGITLQTVTQSNFWQELAATLEALVGNEDGRRVVVNPHSSLVIVRASAEELDLVERFLGMTQESVNRQVILEAKILEVDLSDSFQSGINWAVLADRGSVTATASQTGGGTLFNGTGVSEIAGETGTLLDSSGTTDPVNSTLTSAFGGVFSFALQKNGDFSAFIELLRSQGEVHVLSSPRVSTVNNQKAVIKVGGDQFFVTGVTSSTSSTTGGTTVTSPQIELQSFFSGIALDVSPQIDADGNIILHIHPSISQVTQENKSFTVFDSNVNVPLAQSNIQESDNIVRAVSGQVIVIGGLMKEASTEDQASVPLLGDLPLIGGLFKHRRISRIKKELVILLKPTVVDGGGNWRKAVEESRSRLVRTQSGDQP